MSARVKADTPEEGIEKLVRFLHGYCNGGETILLKGGEEYVHIYINTDAIGLNDINEWDDEQGETHYREDNFEVGDRVWLDTSAESGFETTILEITEMGFVVEGHCGLGDLTVPGDRIRFLDEEGEDAH
jgi:hypothetical protein